MNAATKTLVSRRYLNVCGRLRTDANGSMAEDTVLVEPVSADKFAFHREITGIHTENSRIGAGCRANPAEMPTVSGRIPVAAKTGILPDLSGNSALLDRVLEL
jgi:hypothetical protein